MFKLIRMRSAWYTSHIYYSSRVQVSWLSDGTVYTTCSSFKVLEVSHPATAYIKHQGFGVNDPNYDNIKFLFALILLLLFNHLFTQLISQQTQFWNCMFNHLFWSCISAGMSFHSAFVLFLYTVLVFFCFCSQSTVFFTVSRVFTVKDTTL